MSRRSIAVLVAVLTLMSACASEGLPNSYTDQDARAERQFVETCEVAMREAGDSPVAEADIPDYCQCAFYTVAAELTFDEFLNLDERLKDDPEGLLQPERQLLESVSLPCQFTADDINLTATTE